MLIIAQCTNAVHICSLIILKQDAFYNIVRYKMSHTCNYVNYYMYSQSTKCFQIRPNNCVYVIMFIKFNSTCTFTYKFICLLVCKTNLNEFYTIFLAGYLRRHCFKSSIFFPWPHSSYTDLQNKKYNKKKKNK